MGRIWCSFKLGGTKFETLEQIRILSCSQFASVAGKGNIAWGEGGGWRWKLVPWAVTRSYETTLVVNALALTLFIGASKRF